MGPRLRGDDTETCAMTSPALPVDRSVRVLCEAMTARLRSVRSELRRLRGRPVSEETFQDFFFIGSECAANAGEVPVFGADRG